MLASGVTGSGVVEDATDGEAGVGVVDSGDDVVALNEGVSETVVDNVVGDALCSGFSEVEVDAALGEVTAEVEGSGVAGVIELLDSVLKVAVAVDSVG